MQCFQAGEDMLLFGTRVFQRSPPGKLTILLNAPQAKQERTVPHFLCDHVFMSVHSLYCVHLERRIVLYWQAGEAWQSPDQASLTCLANAPQLFSMG